MNEYRVNLDVYNGPLDLLLYLIRREEVDIYDIPISRITGQYLKYVEVLQQVDPNLAGEFLVLAATLMEVKTRMLLPTPPPEEGGTEAVGGLDPRTELVRQLLQYKAFKDAAADLQTAADVRAMKFERRPTVPDAEAGEFDLEDVQVWDLLDAFSRMMASIGKQAGEHQVIYDDTPVELHAADIMDRLTRDGAMSFRQIFEGRTNRGEIVGLFLALLELVRQKKIVAVQDANFGDIQIQPRTEEMVDRPAGFADTTEEAEASATGSREPEIAEQAAEEPEIAGADPAQATAAADGQYVSDAPADENEPPVNLDPDEGQKGEDNEHPGEADGIGA